MEISIINENKRFQKHISDDNNEKIIFSGIFGIGKTYFLKKFFEEKSDIYETFYISPVDYSISQNEDIISYIKYELAFELLEKSIKLEQEFFSFSETIPEYIKNNKIGLVQSIAKSLGKIGKGINSLLSIRKDIIKHNTDLQIDEEKDIINFLKKTSEFKGSIYEEDIITQIVSSKVAEFSKKTVLVIDDLDRIDPEHIFRILNVFATHFGFNEKMTNNKFSFCKIILVCDIENIRNIFKAKYGANTDFSGYIDKFSSTDIFIFDNKQNIVDEVYKIVQSIKNKEEISSLSIHSRSGDLLITLLREFVRNDIINLRSLMKYYNKTIPLQNIYFDAYGKTFAKNKFIIIESFELLATFFGSLKNLEIAFEQYLSRQVLDISSKEYKNFLGILMILIDLDNHKFIDAVHIFEYNSIQIEYRMTNEHFAFNCEIIEVSKGKEEWVDISLPSFINLAFKKYLALTKKEYR